MITRTTKKRSFAFSILELVIVIAIILIVLAYVFVSFGLNATYGRAGRVNKIKCANNLKGIGMAASSFAVNHDGQFPPVSNSTKSDKTNIAIEALFTVLKDEIITPKILTCRSDTREESTNWSTLSHTNISYFLRISPSSTNIRSLYSGDRNLTLNGAQVAPGPVKFPRDAVPTWDKNLHKNHGNLLMSDGSVHQLPNARLAEQWKNMASRMIPLFCFRNHSTRRARRDSALSIHAQA
jgi:type II secretory pathway pseudopilin PulG